MALQSSFDVNIALALTGAAKPLSVTPAASLAKRYSLSWATGTAANQADKMWHNQSTLASGLNEDIDLAGTLTDAFGLPLTMVKLKAIVISAAAANTTNLSVTAKGTNGVPFLLALGDGVVLYPGGLFVLAAPGAGGLATVAAGTADLINVLNGSGNPATYDVIVVGTSA